MGRAVAHLCQRPLDRLQPGGRCQRTVGHPGPCMLSLMAFVARFDGPGVRSDLEYMLSVPGGETWRCGLTRIVAS